MRISDWSSDVCSSDLAAQPARNFCHRRKLVEGAQPVTRFIFLVTAAALAFPAVAAPSDVKMQVGRANDAARVQPDRATFLNAIQKYAWADGALFQIYTAPGQVTDIALQEVEEHVGPGTAAAGDTVRWIIGDTLSGAGVSRGVHILDNTDRKSVGEG